MLSPGIQGPLCVITSLPTVPVIYKWEKGEWKESRNRSQFKCNYVTQFCNSFMILGNKFNPYELQFLTKKKVLRIIVAQKVVMRNTRGHECKIKVLDK